MPEQGGDVLRLIVVNLADEAQRAMDLVVVLPAGVGDAAHRGQKCCPHRAQWADRYEQAVHDGSPINPRRKSGLPLSLEKAGRSPDLGV